MSSAPRILVCSVNWLGDAVMAMPAIQLLRERRPDVEIVLLAKAPLAPLWTLHAAPSRIISLPPAGDSLGPVVRELRDLEFEVSYILPNSFRSVLAPFRARIPRRIGAPGHFPRSFLLTDVRRPVAGPGRTHQAYEYIDLFFPGENIHLLPPPRLTVPSPVLEAMRAKLAAMPRPWISLLPGAARGTAKQWPVESYAETGALLAEQTGGSLVVLGTRSEQDVCRQVAAAAPRARDLAGATTLPELAAALALSAVVLCNDSGGMHLAAALGTPLVALYGITNPDQTGPLGGKIRILQHSEKRARDVPRQSAEAAAALRAIHPAEVVQAARDLLGPA